MRAVDIIRKKRDGLALDADEIEAFVAGATSGDLPEYQAAALLMAIVLRGMNQAETAELTRAMTQSGRRLDLSDLPGPKVDKHSTGGVGDKTSLIVAPLAAACGVIVPMISGRGLGHTGGTLDKLEAIPGFRVDLTLVELREVLVKAGFAMIGQTEEIAPADKVLYRLRDVTGTVESIPLITASILSKKLSEGIGALVLDVKCGLGAFMKNRAEADSLARSLVDTGRANGLHTEAVLSAMDMPLGRAVGNAIEVRECLETLRGNGPSDVEELSLYLASRMVSVGHGIPLVEAQARVRKSFAAGAGLAKLRELIHHQGGDARIVDEPALLPSCKHRGLARAGRTGYVSGIQAQQVGHAAMLLGAGRSKATDVIDPAVGIVITARPGELVRQDEPVAEVHYRDSTRLGEVLAILERAWQITDEKPDAKPVIMDTMHS